jgi:hypothetical protein
MGWFHSRRWLTRFSGSLRSVGGSKKRLPARKLYLEALENLTLLSTLDVTGGSLTYMASAGVDNNLNISLGGGVQPTSYNFSDTGENITLTTNAMLAGWTGSGTNTVTGPISSVNFNFTVNLLTGADELNVDGNINVLNNVNLQSGQDLTLNAAAISALGTTSLTVGTGAISQTGAASVTAANLALLASTGIGSATTPLATDVGNLEAETNTGGIFIVNGAASPTTLNIGGVDPAPAGVQVTGSSGEISLTNTSSINITTDGDVVRGPGDVTVSALGSTSDVITGGQVTSGLAAIGIPAGGVGNVLVQAGRDIVAGSGSIGSIGAESGDVSLIAGRDLTIDNGSHVGSLSNTVTTSGPVSLQAGRDILVDNEGEAGDLSALGTVDGGLLVNAGRDITVDHTSGLGDDVNQATSATDIVVTAGRNVLVNNGSFLGNLSSSSLTVTAGTTTVGNISGLAGSAFKTAGGAINLTTSAVGVFTLSGGSTVDSTTSSGGGDITISADDMVLDTTSPASSITASSTGIVLLQQAGQASHAIDLGGGASGGALNLSDGELGLVTAGVLRIGRADNPGSIAVTGPITAHSGYSVMSLFTGGGIAAASGGSIAVNQLAVQAVNAVVLDQGNDVAQALAASVTGPGQGFTFTQGSANTLSIVSVDGVTGITTNGGAISVITTGSGLQVNTAINAGSAPITLTAGGTDNLLSISAIVNNGGANAITLTGDRMDIEATITNTSTGRVTLQPSSANQPINLGSALDPTGSLNLSNNELNEIQTGGVLQVGNSSAGSIFVSTMISPFSVLAFSLQTGNGITQAPGSSQIDVAELALRSVGAVILTSGNNIGQAFAASVTGAGQGFAFVQGFTTMLVIGSVDGMSGITTTDGVISLAVDDGDMQVSSAINAGSAPINLSTSRTDGLLSISATISNAGVNPIVLTADRMDLKAAITNDSTGRVTLQPSTPGRPLDLGSTLDPIGTLNLSNNELNEVQTSGVLQVGNTSAGLMVVSTTISPATVPTLSLQTYGGITQAAGTHITAPKLALQSNGAVVLDQGNNIGQALAASVTGFGQDFTFTQGFSATLTIGTVDGLTGITAASGSVVLAAPIINLAANVSSAINQTYNGPVTLAANTTLTSAGNLVFSSTIQSPKTAFSLSVTTGGTTTFSGAVGGNNNPLGALTLGATGSTQINGGSVNTAGLAQAYGNTVTLGATPTVLSGNVAFNGNLILGGTATTAVSTLQITGALSFSKTTTLTSTFAGTTSTQFGHIVDTGATTFTGATLALNYSKFAPAVPNTFDVVSSGAAPITQFANVVSPGPVFLTGVPYTVSYAGGASGKDLVLTVVQAPIFTSANSTTFTVNTAGAFKVVVTGSPTPTLKMTGTLPTGVKFTASTGVLAGTPTVFGVFPLTFTAGNSVNAAVTQSFTLIVSGIPTYATTPNQRYIAQVYNDLLGSVVDPGGLAAWSGLLNQGVSHSQVVYEIETDSGNQFRTVEVQQLYHRYLGRSGESAALAYAVAGLAGGGTVQQLGAGIVGSNEYFKDAGGNNTGFLQTMYKEVLGRPIDPNALAVDLAGLASGISATEIALSVMTSPEADQVMVQSVYQTYLHRTADPMGLAYSVQLLESGVTYEQLIAFVMGSNEFIQNDVGP